MAVTTARRARPTFARAWVTAALAVVVLVCGAIALPGPAQRASVGVTSGSAPPTGLPGCQADELAARHAGYDEWADTLLDPSFALPADYEPPDLALRRLGGSRVQLRAFVFDDLVVLLDAAASDGVRLTINSSYRSFAQQAALFTDMEAAHGTGYANEFAARAGHSEHQLGTTVDLGGGDAWLAANAWRYGFVMSYPADRSPAWTCYGPEPWHYRYFGRQRAAAIKASGLSPREWLWRFADAS